MLVLEGEPATDNWGGLVIKGTYEEEINPANDYTIIAKEVEDEKRGKQYELMFIGQLINLSTVNNQKAFLKTFLTDLQILEMFKVLENPLKVIEDHDTGSLKKVNGVGDFIANCIIDRFEDNKDNCEVYLELDEYGLTPKFIQKLIKKYKNPHTVIEIIKTNPYKLSFDIDGIGFKTADAIALKSGINETSPERIKGYIHFILNDLGQSGNSYITSGELTGYIFDEFGGKENILEVYTDEEGNITGNNIGQAIEELTEKEIIVLEDSENKANRKVYLKKYYDLENEICKHLRRIASAKNDFEYNNWEEIVATQEQKQGWKFTDEQKNGIKLGLDNQICFITGGAGTGKSSLVSGILESLKKYSFAQTALAGKASARLQEVTGKEGYTIHRLLGFLPPNGFNFNEENPLEYDIIVLDEISLVGGEIFLSLIKAIPDGCKLIILGDMGQLESIGCMNLAHDIYNSDYITTIELTKIHRQAQKSGIITASQSIRNGEPIFDKKFVGFETMGELQDMHFDIVDTSSETREMAVKHFIEKYNSCIVKKEIMDIQILATCKERGNSSVFNLNQDIQKYLNPQEAFKQEIEVQLSKDKQFFLREGDKVMCIKNNYKLFNIEGIKTPVFNGWVGILKTINVYTNMVEIFFPIINDTVCFTITEVSSSVILGYASTTHKYQGSSAKCIIGVLDSSVPPDMLTKELLYTMITRAEDECTIVAQNAALYKAVLQSGISDKNTFLTELLDKKIA
ncbi:AAA family ATPase [Lacrimispora sp.]|uniref:AAA family ATPase n=1 Tax=Lacrimispora sp. TaxID=2719234 RepID=UPI0028A79EBF|nr:AAA family ATPase [Lacrimispora sp.]